MNIFYANAGSHLSPSVSGAQIRAGAQHPSDYADAHVCPASSVRVMTKPWNLFWGLNHRTEEGEDTQAPWNINSGRKPPRDPGTVPRESVTRETSCANAPTSWPMHQPAAHHARQRSGEPAAQPKALPHRGVARCPQRATSAPMGAARAGAGHWMRWRLSTKLHS